jgi:hypothetical protein
MLIDRYEQFTSCSYVYHSPRLVLVWFAAVVVLPPSSCPFFSLSDLPRLPLHSIYLIHARFIVEKIGCIFIAVKTFREVNHVLIDSIERFFRLWRRALRNDLMGFADLTDLVFDDG